VPNLYFTTEIMKPIVYRSQHVIWNSVTNFWNNSGGKRYPSRETRRVAVDREAIICLGSVVPHRQFSRPRCSRLFRAFRARSARPIAVYFPATGIRADRACRIVNARERAFRRAIQSMAESGDAAARTCLPACLCTTSPMLKINFIDNNVIYSDFG